MAAYPVLSISLNVFAAQVCGWITRHYTVLEPEVIYELRRKGV